MRRKLVAWQGLRPCGMNRAVTQSHMEEVYTEHRVRTERRREQQGRRFFSDLRGVDEFRDGWIPGVPEVVSQFQRK